MKLANDIANWLVANGAAKENKELYRYGAECFLNEIISEAFLLLFAGLSGRLIEMVIWLICFTVLRVNIGGYHSKSYIVCMILSITLGCSAILFYPILISLKIIMIVFSVLLLYVVIKIAPVLNVNHPISTNKKKKVKKLSIGVGSIEVLLILGNLKDNVLLSSLIFSAFMCATILGIIGYMKNKKISTLNN